MKQKLRRLLWLLLAGGLLMGFWYGQLNTIETEVLEIPSARLPAGFDGFRIVEIADLHGKEFGTDNSHLLSAVRAAAPDLIAITGDLADEHTNLSMIAPLLQGLTAIGPTYFVTGNHEWALDDPGAFLKLLEQHHVTVLRNEYCLLERNGDSLVLAGVDDPNGPWDMKTPEELAGEIREALGDPYILMLAHRNEEMEQWSSLQVDTVLTGHAHGGIIRLPKLGGLIGHKKLLFPDYDAGLYRAGRTTMMVSRGLGTSGPPIRLWNLPHLPVLVLRTISPGKTVNNP